MVDGSDRLHVKVIEFATTMDTRAADFGGP